MDKYEKQFSIFIDRLKKYSHAKLQITSCVKGLFNEVVSLMLKFVNNMHGLLFSG